MSAETLIPIMSRVNMPRRIIVRKTAYDFVVKNNVSLAWVKNDDVQAVLRLRGGCCNHDSLLFKLANERVVEVWKGVV